VIIPDPLLGLPAWLENRNTNITTELACITKVFSDFRLVAQIREEIEKVKIYTIKNPLIIFNTTPPKIADTALATNE
jgi:hypothetical protein